MLCKGLLFFGIILLFLDTDAQILKGTTCRSADLYVSYQTRDVTNGTAKYFDLSLSPSFGVFLAQNFSLNVALGVNMSNSTQPQPSGDSKNETLGYFFEPYLQFYKTITDKFLFNMALYGGYEISQNKYTFASSETKTTSNHIYFGLRPGITYFVTDRIALSSSFGTIGYSLWTDDAKKKTSQFTTSFGLNSLNFGLTWYIQKKI